jgi:iron complex transport system substrate-binding protein
MKKSMKKLIVAILTVIMMVTLAACTSNSKEVSSSKIQKEDSATKYPYTAKDSKGKEVVIEKEPKRIISVAPSVTELIYALGKGDELVGRTDYDDYPEQVKSVQSIGSLTDPNVEKIIELKPDVVVASTHFKDDVAKKLEDLGIKVVVLYNAKDFNGAYDSINTLGQIINAQDNTKNLVASMKKKIEDVKEKVKGKETPKTYYVVGFGKDGDYTATGDTFIGQMIEMAGGNNIAKDGAGWKYSLEKIIENGPEYIVISKNFGMKDQFITTAGYKELSAVKNNKVIEIDDNLLNRQGPRLADGVEALAKILHPDVFK